MHICSANGNLRKTCRPLGDGDSQFVCVTGRCVNCVAIDIGLSGIENASGVCSNCLAGVMMYARARQLNLDYANGWHGDGLRNYRLTGGFSRIMLSLFRSGI